MNFDQYLNTYFTQLFTTLGTISGVVFSSAFAIPMFSYYVRRIQTTFKTEIDRVHDKMEKLEQILNVKTLSDEKKHENVEEDNTDTDDDDTDTTSTKYSTVYKK
jgi:hypothetical protein